MKGDPPFRKQGHQSINIRGRSDPALDQRACSTDPGITFLKNSAFFKACCKKLASNIECSIKTFLIILLWRLSCYVHKGWHVPVQGYGLILPGNEIRQVILFCLSGVSLHTLFEKRDTAGWGEGISVDPLFLGINPSCRRAGHGALCEGPV